MGWCVYTHINMYTRVSETFSIVYFHIKLPLTLLPPLPSPPSLPPLPPLRQQDHNSSSIFDVQCLLVKHVTFYSGLCYIRTLFMWVLTWFISLTDDINLGYWEIQYNTTFVFSLMIFFITFSLYCNHIIQITYKIHVHWLLTVLCYR